MLFRIFESGVLGLLLVVRYIQMSFLLLGVWNYNPDTEYCIFKAIFNYKLYFDCHYLNISQEIVVRVVEFAYSEFPMIIMRRLNTFLIALKQLYRALV